ncbi:hypothetical protein EDB85DRAFT_2293360 [Lactarius pseudohatsudake]|nr:hypothetical protein EDB85DRAFT_2293360 [Lactarius pseudohatsudake]
MALVVVVAVVAAKLPPSPCRLAIALVALVAAWSLCIHTPRRGRVVAQGSDWPHAVVVAALGLGATVGPVLALAMALRKNVTVAAASEASGQPWSWGVKRQCEDLKLIATSLPPPRFFDTRKTRHHANPLPASSVVTPPNHVPTADDDRTTSIGYRRRRLLAGTDGSKHDDDDIDIDNTDDTRPATTMVTNVTCNKRIPRILQASQVPAIAASLHVGPASTLRQSTTTTPSRRKTRTDATPSRCKTHHDTNLPRRHPQRGAQDPPRRNPLPASPAVVPSKYSMQEPANPPQRRPDTAQAHLPRASPAARSPLAVRMRRASPTADNDYSIDDKDDNSKDQDINTDNTSTNDTDVTDDDSRGARSTAAADNYGIMSPSTDPLAKVITHILVMFLCKRSC